MASIPDFDFEEAFDALATASKQFQPGSREEKAIQLAASALLYVSTRGRFKAFREWHEESDKPYSRAHFNASHEFATREEADAWLASGKAKDHERVIIAGKGFQVIELPNRGLRFIWAPLPEELAALDDEPSP